MADVLHAEMGGIEMSEWIKYDGSDKQIAEMRQAHHGYILMNDVGGISDVSLGLDTNGLRNGSDKRIMFNCSIVTNYLICQPHPYADLIKKWADTGCPVWVRPTKPYEFKISDYLNHPTTRLMVDGKGVYLITTTPDWNIPGEYSLTPFED